MNFKTIECLIDEKEKESLPTTEIDQNMGLSDLWPFAVQKRNLIRKLKKLNDNNLFLKLC